MIGTVDKLGRIVIPKPIRDSMRIGAGSAVEMTLVDGELRLAVPATEPDFFIAPDGYLVLGGELAPGVDDLVTNAREERNRKLMGLSTN